MDLANGSFSPTGAVPPTIQFFVPRPNGTLLTMSFDGNLSSIDPVTGTTSVIGATGFSDCSSPSSPTCGPNSQLSFGSSGGTLFATDFANNLYTLKSHDRPRNAGWAHRDSGHSIYTPFDES